MTHDATAVRVQTHSTASPKPAVRPAMMRPSTPPNDHRAATEVPRDLRHPQPPVRKEHDPKRDRLARNSAELHLYLDAGCPVRGTRTLPADAEQGLILIEPSGTRGVVVGDISPWRGTNGRSTFHVPILTIPFARREHSMHTPKIAT